MPVKFVECDICGKEFHPKGIGPHKRAKHSGFTVDEVRSAHSDRKRLNGADVSFENFVTEAQAMFTSKDTKSARAEMLCDMYGALEAIRNRE